MLVVLDSKGKLVISFVLVVLDSKGKLVISFLFIDKVLITLVSMERGNNSG